MQNTNKIKPAFPLSLLTCALALATGVASAQTIEVTNGETYTQNGLFRLFGETGSSMVPWSRSELAREKDAAKFPS